MNKVQVVGDGLLADYVLGILETKCLSVIRSDLQSAEAADADLVLVLNDGWEPSVHQQAERVLQPLGIPWLRGFVLLGEGIIGPFVRPGSPGCSQCADLRYLMAGQERREMKELRYLMEEMGGTGHDADASRTALLQMAHLIALEAESQMTGTGAKSERSVALLNMTTLTCYWHSFLPDSACAVCGNVREDSAEAAVLSIQSSPKLSIDSYRCLPMEALSEKLPKDYLDTRMGFLNRKVQDLTPPFADVSVNLPLSIGDEGAAGRTNSYKRSESTAILEGLERYCGLEPRSKRTAVHDSYHQLGDQALNPLTLGTHPEENYEAPHFPFKPFDPDRPMDWVWGYSLLQERPILVPELLAYYSLGCGDGFVYETSNGCALGGSLEEAIFYGILEVVERDSFLMTWYARLPLARLDPYSSGDQELNLMLDRARAAAGYDIHLFNATMEHGIPSIWALAKNRKEKGLNLICAAGAHPDPVRAVKSALFELGAMMMTLDEKLEKDKGKYERMFHDAALVKQMEDHGMLFGLPETEERLQFLLDSKAPVQTFSEAFKRGEIHTDMKDELEELLRKLKRLNLDVIVVDQTIPEINRNGLYCVKVIIPGMLPMTFGHHLIRVAGLDRVLQVPMELGYTKQPLTVEQLNPFPHPFP